MLPALHPCSSSSTCSSSSRTASCLLPAACCGSSWGMFHVCRMSGDEGNPAAAPQPVDDIQGDGRWISQVLERAQEFKLNSGCVFSSDKRLLLQLLCGSKLLAPAAFLPLVRMRQHYSAMPFLLLSDPSLRLSRRDVNPAQLMRLEPSAGVQALHRMGHQTNLVELKGFLSQKAG